MINPIIGFCIPNEEQTTFIINLINKFIASKTSIPTITSTITATATISDTTTNRVIQTKAIDLIVNRINTKKMLVILECLSDSRFTTKMDNGWGQLLKQVVNANNSNEVIEKFWKRGSIGEYSDVKYEEIYNAFTNMKILEEFNNAPLWRMAKEDNPELYNKNFNKYDEPEFEYEYIIFKDDKCKDTQYINYQQVIDYFGNTQHRFIKSGLGTGKTTFIEKHIKEYEIHKLEEYQLVKDITKLIIQKVIRIVFFTMRQSLAYSLMVNFEELGFKNYLNKNTPIYSDTKMVIISIDSIEKIAFICDDDFRINPYDIVICDEICSLLSHFSFKEMKNSELSYQIFKRVIKTSKECYYLDGDISNREIKWFNKYIREEGQEVKKPLCNMLSGLKYNLNLTYCKNGQYNKFIKDLASKKKIVIVCMSSTEAITVYDMLSTKYMCKVIHGNSNDKEKAELQNVNEMVKDIDCFIYSPTITVGVNIDVEHFDNIYGYVCESSVCARDYFQMLARIRKPRNNTINILLANFDIKLNGLFNVKSFDDYYKLMYGDELVNGLSYIKLWNKWEQDNKAYWLDIFKWYAERKGHIFNIIETSKEDYKKESIKLGENMEKYNFKINKTNKCDTVYNALLLKQFPDKIVSYVPDSIKNSDIMLEKHINNKNPITEEDKELLLGIDIRNNWDNMETVGNRIKEGQSNTFDKLNFEKSLYYYYFGLGVNITQKVFSKYFYNKLDIVKNYQQLNNIKDLFDISPVIEYGNDFNGELFNKKARHFNDVTKLLGIDNITGTNKIIEDININYNAIEQLLKTDDCKLTYSIMDKSKSSKKINKKNGIEERKLTKIQIISNIRNIIGVFGYDLENKQIRINGNRVYVYEFITTPTITSYLNKLQMLGNIEEEVEIVEYDF